MRSTEKIPYSTFVFAGDFKNFFGVEQLSVQTNKYHLNELQFNICTTSYRVQTSFSSKHIYLNKKSRKLQAFILLV